MNAAYVTPGKVPSIALVIPNYNDSRYLPDCLASVLEQRERPEQIVFVDDASTDDSVAIARQMLGDMPGAQIVVSAARQGTMAALNEGLRHVTCDYVLFLASNDHLDGEILIRVRASIARFGFVGLWSAMVWAVDESGTRRYIHPSAVVSTCESALSPEHCQRLARRLGNWFTGTTMFFHRETLQGLGGFDSEYRGLADLIAALTVSSLHGAIFCPEPFGVMRLHDGGYLWRTLTEYDKLEHLITGFLRKAPGQSSELFDAKFLTRTERRIRFAAIRAMTPHSWPGISYSAWQQGRYRCLRVLGRVAPSGLRTVLAYLLLRPFDILPALWYRSIKLYWVRLRAVVCHETAARTKAGMPAVIGERR